MHNPSTHLNSNSGHGDECDVEAFTISFFCFIVVVSSGGFWVVVAGFLMVLRNLLGIFVVVDDEKLLVEILLVDETLLVDELLVELGLMKIGTTPSPVETMRSPSESL